DPAGPSTPTSLRRKGIAPRIPRSVPVEQPARCALPGSARCVDVGGALRTACQRAHRAGFSQRDSSWSQPSGGVQIDILVDGHRVEASQIFRCIENGPLPLLWEAAREVSAEFRVQQWPALGAASPMTDRILHDNFVQYLPARQMHGQAIGDGTLQRIQIVDCELRILAALDLGAQRVDSNIARDAI